MVHESAQSGQKNSGIIEGRFQLWHAAVHGEWYYTGSGARHLCYAEPGDGLNFEKPNLGLVEYRGSTDNNILLAER